MIRPPASRPLRVAAVVAVGLAAVLSAQQAAPTSGLD